MNFKLCKYLTALSLGSEIGITSELSKLIFFVQTFAIINVCFDSVNEFFQRVIVSLRPEEPHHNHRQDFPVQIPVKLVDNVRLHGSLLESAGLDFVLMGLAGISFAFPFSSISS